MKIELESYALSAFDVLLCPSCGENNLHQTSASVYFRDKEDSNEGNFVHLNNKYIEKIDNRLNPSDRRDGILIAFECEHCEADPHLTIVQHKGATYIEWLSIRNFVKG
jgi:hypothetical protein